MTYERSIKLSFRGFEHPDDLIAAVGVVPTMIARKGEPTRPGRDVVYAKNSVGYAHPFSHEMRWDDAIDLIIQHLGGLEKLETIVRRFRPQHVQIDLILPVRNSEEQEDNYISAETMAKLVSLNASFGCSFVKG